MIWNYKKNLFKKKLKFKRTRENTPKLCFMWLWVWAVHKFIDFDTYPATHLKSRLQQRKLEQKLRRSHAAEKGESWPLYLSIHLTKINSPQFWNGSIPLSWGSPFSCKLWKQNMEPRKLEANKNPQAIFIARIKR
jgi:hypothetical protein